MQNAEATKPPELPQADASTLVDRAELERQVQEVYRGVARDPHASRHFETGADLALRLGYPKELVAAIHTIAAGEALLSPSVTSRVIERMAEQPAVDPERHARLEKLTPREREVLELLARGLSNGEIASALVIEESTVKTHVKRIHAKLGVRDRVQVVIFANESGLTPPGSAAGG